MMIIPHLAGEVPLINLPENVRRLIEEDEEPEMNRLLQDPKKCMLSYLFFVLVERFRPSIHVGLLTGSSRSLNACYSCSTESK